jgi:hypothetical protein
MNCPKYEPSDKMGKTRPICKWWNASNNGSCNRQVFLMCIIWEAQRWGGEIVRVEERKDENN